MRLAPAWRHMARTSTQRYEATYAKLLRLYPKSYRQRFAEPMQQLFADICHERNQSGQDTGGFAYKIYAETLASVLTERIQEVVMNIKANRPKVVIGVSLIGIIATVALLNSRPATGAQPIQPGTWLKQVRKLSEGDKAACLANVSSAADAVKHDDSFTEFRGQKFSNFEEVEGEAIADIPAGTNYDLTINSYANNTVKGTMTYDKNYGTYNYTTQKLPAHGQWKLVSVVACKKP